MKNYYLQLSITVLLIIFSFASCSDEVDQNFDLIGTWNRTVILENGINTIDDCQNKDFIHFMTDGTFYREYYGYENEICELNNILNTTWELSENTLFITNRGNAVNITFTNKNTFEVSLNQDTKLEIWERN